MDCFDMRYYRLNQKLMRLVGQWPYQRRAEKIRMWMTFLFVVALQVLLQGGQAMNTDLDYEYCIEFLSESLVTVLISIRYLGNAINNDKIKGLLEDIRHTWRSLVKTDERDFFRKSVEEGRLYVIRYAMMMWWLLISDLILLLLSPLLAYTPLTNVSCPLVALYFPDLFADPDKYCYPVLLCVAFIILSVMVSLYAIDMMFITFLFHAVAMFKLACYRLEHLFDESAGITGRKSFKDRSNVHEKIADAVECHRTAVRFCNNIIATYEWMNLISRILVLVGIAMTLYWTIMSKGETIKTWINLSSGMGQICHIFLLGLPAQRIIDNSEAIVFKCYSALWYTVRVEEQSLILLTMQRGLKPSAILLGGCYTTSLENFAAEMKASFSYLTMLMSLG